MPVVRSSKDALRGLLPDAVSPTAARVVRASRRAVRRIIGATRYRGDAVACPICSWTGRQFMPYGGRVNALCPSCESLERHRMYYLYLRERSTILDEAATILHVAPERALSHLFRARPNIDYVTSDLYDPDVTVRADLTNLPFADDTFDFILCSHVLEHVPDDRAAMREMYRTLKPGRFAIIQVPLDGMDRATTFEDPTATTPDERLRLFGQIDHVRIYGQDYVDRLRESGFTVDIVPFADELGDTIVQRNGLFAGERIYRCSKSG